MRTVVTGGAGFIGSNLVDALVARGDDVTVIDDISTGRRENLEQALATGATLHELSVVDAQGLRDAIALAEPEVVFHLAAQIDVRRSVADPGIDARVNVEGTVNVLEAARLAGAQRVVYSSTGGAIYGDSERVPTGEDAPTRPLSPYGQAKHAGEGYCALYRQLHGLETVVLRYANVYGPRQDPLGEGGVIAIFCGKLSDHGQPTVFGDGRQTRDYVHVADVVRANLLAADAPAQTAGPFNIGSGIETSVLELVDAFREIGGNSFEPQFAPSRAGEVLRSCLSARRAREQLGWEASISLPEGIRGTLAHVESSRQPFSG
ncbi:MAG TPA: NAD-dependent epimerase/dehydratase family protein [Conexibacter sp.]|jgi:UDP-glucose 4-epimerase